MPHSPYQKTVYPAIKDLQEYRLELTRQRARLDDGELDEQMLLVYAEILLDQCDFLDDKLDVKVRNPHYHGDCQGGFTYPLAFHECCYRDRLLMKRICIL